MSKYIAVPKKNEGNPNASGAVERNLTERKQNTTPEIMNNADIIYVNVYNICAPLTRKKVRFLERFIRLVN